MSKELDTLKQNAMRRGASEIVEDLLKREVFFETKDGLANWCEQEYDMNQIGWRDDSLYDVVLEEMMDEVHDRVYEWFHELQDAILDKAFIVQKTLDYDPDL